MRSPSWRNADIQQMLKFWGLPSRSPGGGRRDRQTILAFWDEQVVIMLLTFFAHLCFIVAGSAQTGDHRSSSDARLPPW